MTGYRFLPALLLCCALASPAAATDPPPPVTFRAVVKAPIDEVWHTLTTEDGVVTFFASSAKVEPRVGGAYEMYFLLDNQAGLRGGEGNRILAMEAPSRLLVSWNAPPNFGPLRSQHTVVEYLLTELTEGETLVESTHSGWGRGSAWGQVRDYFHSAWQVVLGRLQYRFDRGPVDWSNPPQGAEYFRPAGNIGTASR